jgi:hypothetical protein
MKLRVAWVFIGSKIPRISVQVRNRFKVLKANRTHIQFFCLFDIIKTQESNLNLFLVTMHFKGLTRGVTGSDTYVWIDNRHP